MARDRRLTAEANTLLTKLMVLGSQTALPIELSGRELARVIGVIYRDTKRQAALPAAVAAAIVPATTYYETPNTWFEATYSLEGTDHVDLFLRGQRDIPDFLTYLRCLAELHKRRKKYALILCAQPIPTMLQVAPRSLIEYGEVQADVLASWITWRKWFYDLDNRSAQESGYLFEPILAAALGGEPASARNSPIRRTADDTKRRQVDCILVKEDASKHAYEFKLRVTIAASGQGRFGEELDFAVDCQNSGYRPVLLVLDPTPNHRLADLEAAFRATGGEAYTGDAAWAHLEAEAGPTMAGFIEAYVREPIRRVSSFEGELLDFSSRRLDNGDVELQLGALKRLLRRHEDTALGAPDEPDV